MSNEGEPLLLTEDDYASLRRLKSAAEKLDDRAASILAHHAAVENELDIVLGRLLPHPDRLKGLGFGQKASIVCAAWLGPPEVCAIVDRGLLRLNELRNGIAHGNDRNEIDKKIERYGAATGWNWTPADPQPPRIELMTAFLFGRLALADRSTPPEILAIGAEVSLRDKRS